MSGLPRKVLRCFLALDYIGWSLAASLLLISLIAARLPNTIRRHVLTGRLRIKAVDETRFVRRHEECSNPVIGKRKTGPRPHLESFAYRAERIVGFVSVSGKSFHRGTANIA